MAPGRKRGANKALAIGELRLGDLVLAKIKGFPAWPAKISRPEDWKQVPDPKKHFVYFFGTKEIGFVTPPDIQVFTTEAKEKLLQKCKGKTVKYFAQAVEEISAAFEESQNHKSDILDPAGHDGKSDKFDSRSDPCLGKLVEDNGAETKPDLGEQDSLKSNDRTTSQSSEPVEHGSLDPILKVADSRDKIDGVTCTDHGKNSANGQRIIKKTADDTNKRSKDEVHRAKRVPDNRAATDSHLRGQKLKGNKKGQEHGSKIESCDNKVVLDVKIASSKKPKELLKEKPIARACGEILEKKKKFESEIGKSASGADDSERAVKRQRSEDAKDQKQCKRKRLLPVGEGKADGKNQIDKEAAACTKRRKETVEHTSVSSFSGPLNKEGTNRPEQKITSSSDSDVKVPAAQLPKRRRAVCIYDDDDDDDDEDPKTPVDGGYTNVVKAKLASTDGPKSSKHPEQKMKLSSDSDVKVPAAQLPKRRRAVCIYDDDDDDEDPKTPVHGGYTNVVKAKLASTDGPKRSKHPEQKMKLSSDSDVKVPAAQLPKRRRAVCIYDADDDDEHPKTPVHGGHTNVPKAKLASTDGPKSAYASHDTSIKAKLLAGSAESAKKGKVHLYQHNKDASLALPGSMEGYNSPMGKPVKALLPKNIKPNLSSPKNSHLLVSFKKQVTGENKTAKVSGSGMPDSVEGPSNSSSIGKPLVKLPPQNIKQIFRSPSKSPQLLSTMGQVAGQNKVAKVSGVGIPKKCQGDSSKDTMAGSDILSSSHSETKNQRSKPALEENPTGTSKVATCLNDVGVPTGNSVNLSADMITGNQENGSASLISSWMPDSSSSMKHLIAAAQEKRKQAHSHTSPLVNIDHNSFTIDPMQTSQSPFIVQNVSSSAGDAMLIVAQEPQEDSTPSIHGHQSPSSNQAWTEEKEERRFSSGHRSVEGSLSGDTEAAISRDTFEGMLETLSRTKESIGRATRMAINCAKYGIASEVVELLIRKLEIEPHFRRKVDLFFLVDSITQCSHKQKGNTGGLYIPTVQAALPRLLGAAAPPGTGSRENRHQCRKVLRLWLKRKIFPDSLLRRYIGDIGASGDDKTVGFSLRRPSRSERSVDDPLRDMEGMLVDEYGSNASFQLAGFLSSHNFGDDEEDEDLPSTSHEVKNTHMEEPVHALGKLEAHDSSSDKPLCVVDVSGVREMEDASCQLTDDVPSYVCGTGAKEDSPVATYATELLPFPAGSPSLPHESPPSPPPLPPSPPPLSPPPPPSSPPQLPFAPPPSDHFFTPPPAPLALQPPSQSIALARPSMPSHPLLPNKPGFTHPAHALLQHEYQISMQRNQELRPSNTSFLQRPVIRNLAPAPSSHFSFPSHQSEPQRSSFPHPYPFPSQSVDGRRHMNEEAWRMPSNGRNEDTQNGAWISGRNPFPGSLTVTDGFFQPPPERPSGTMSYQFAANNVQGAPTITAASQMLPSRPDVPFRARWRPP